MMINFKKTNLIKICRDESNRERINQFRYLGSLISDKRRELFEIEQRTE